MLMCSRIGNFHNLPILITIQLPLGLESRSWSHLSQLFVYLVICGPDGVLSLSSIKLRCPLYCNCKQMNKSNRLRQPLVSQIDAEQGKGDIKFCSTSFPDAKEKRNAYKTKLTRWGIWSRRYVMHYC